MQGRVDHQRAQRAFIALWGLALLAKVIVAARLPLFVDEAFYWQEAQYPAWAYSDLPGMSAWLAWLGTAVGGDTLLGVRWPFLLLGALVPWWVVRIGMLVGRARDAWLAGCLAILLPLSGTLGILGLPDVPLALATLLCLEAGVRLVRMVDLRAVLLLALGLVLGGLSHYRFAAVIGVGFVVLLWLPAGRRALRDPRVWLGIAAGALAWVPLLAWNLANGDAGLRFQLVDRHPWAPHGDGWWFVPVQLAVVTPLLAVALALAARDQLAPATATPRRYLAACGAAIALGFFVLGWFADRDRVSFHWPLPAWLALLPLVPALLQRWSPHWRRATWAVAAAGGVLAIGGYGAVSLPSVRAALADGKAYPANFAGWDALATATRGTLEAMPRGTQVVADHFKIGSQLGFALRDRAITVLDHPLNHHHGRAPQLRLWGLEADALPRGPLLVVAGPSDLRPRDQLGRWHALCARLGPLPPPRVVQVDHGRQRFLLFALPQGARPGGACVAPAMGYIDAPGAGDTVGRTFEVSGWAIKDGAGIARVEVLLDGVVVARATYGLPNPGVAAFWSRERAGGSTDPNHPHVGFRARVSLPDATPPGRHWLGLRLRGRDGSVEDWGPEQPVEVL